MFIPPIAHRTAQHILEHILLGIYLQTISEKYKDINIITAPTNPILIADLMGILMQSEPHDSATMKISIDTARISIHSLNIDIHHLKISSNFHLIITTIYDIIV